VPAITLAVFVSGGTPAHASRRSFASKKSTVPHRRPSPPARVTGSFKKILHRQVAVLTRILTLLKLIATGKA
jgi:hypothetical protein